MGLPGQKLDFDFRGLFFDIRGLLFAFRVWIRPEPPCIFSLVSTELNRRVAPQESIQSAPMSKHLAPPPPSWQIGHDHIITIVFMHWQGLVSLQLEVRNFFFLLVSPPPPPPPPAKMSWICPWLIYYFISFFMVVYEGSRSLWRLLINAHSAYKARTTTAKNIIWIMLTCILTLEVPCSNPCCFKVCPWARHFSLIV